MCETESRNNTDSINCIRLFEEKGLSTYGSIYVCMYVCLYSIIFSMFVCLLLFVLRLSF